MLDLLDGQKMSGLYQEEGYDVVRFMGTGSVAADIGRPLSRLGWVCTLAKRMSRLA